MDFNIKELQLLNKHLDFNTTLKLKNWIKYNTPTYRNLSDSDKRDAIIEAISRDEITYDQNKGALLPYLKHSINMALIAKSTQISTLSKYFHTLHFSEQINQNTKESKWIDLSYFTDEEIRVLYNALVNNCINDTKEIKELLNEYSKQFNRSKQT